MCPAMTRAQREVRTYGYRLIRDGSVCQGMSPRTRIETAADLHRVLAPMAAVEPVEVFWMIALDTRRQMIGGPVAVSRGTVDSTIVHPREVFLAALVRHAHAIVVAHNHPSGDTTPTIADRQITAGLVAAGKVVGIEVVDHIIVAPDRYLSFADSGMLV